MYAVYKDFILIDSFYDYFDAAQCAAESGGVVYFFLGEPPAFLGDSTTKNGHQQ